MASCSGGGPGSPLARVVECGERRPQSTLHEFKAESSARIDHRRAPSPQIWTWGAIQGGNLTDDVWFVDSGHCLDHLHTISHPWSWPSDTSHPAHRVAYWATAGPLLGLCWSRCPRIRGGGDVSPLSAAKIAPPDAGLGVSLADCWAALTLDRAWKIRCMPHAT